jgi:hypothetical protein
VVFLEAGESNPCFRMVSRFAQAPDDPRTDEPEHAHDVLNKQRDRDALTKRLWKGACQKISQRMEQDSSELVPAEMTESYNGPATRLDQEALDSILKRSFPPKSQAI